MHFQADMINVPVVKPKIMETTSMGAAFGAGLAIGVWKDLKEIRELWSEAERFTPSMDPDERDKNWAGWKKAITRSLGWTDDENDGEEQFLDAKQGGDDFDSFIEKAEKPVAADIQKNATGVGLLSVLTVAVLGVGAGFLLGKGFRRNY